MNEHRTEDWLRRWAGPPPGWPGNHVIRLYEMERDLEARRERGQHVPHADLLNYMRFRVQVLEKIATATPDPEIEENLARARVQLTELDSDSTSPR